MQLCVFTLAPVISFTAFHCFAYFVFVLTLFCLSHCGKVTAVFQLFVCMCERDFSCAFKFKVCIFITTYIHTYICCLLTILCACKFIHFCCMHLDKILACQCFLIFDPKVLPVNSIKFFVLCFLLSCYIQLLNLFNQF